MFQRKKTRRFIDPKHATTFTLVHRPQTDPLVTDESAPQRVLVETSNAKTKEEERKWGVFYDDDYDYLKHLKTREEFFAETEWQEEPKGRQRDEPSAAPKQSLQLPSSVLPTPSEFQDDVGVLNRAAPQSGPLVDWDPDIVETLDDDYKCERVFTLKDEEGMEEDGDDLDMLLAEATAGNGGECIDEEDEGGEQDFDSDFGGRSDDEFDFDEEEEEDDRRSTVFTQYSMTSVNVPRTEDMARLDEQFENFMEREYQEQYVGNLDLDDIEGSLSVDSSRTKMVVEEHRRLRAEERQKMDHERMTSIPEEYKYVEEGEEREKEPNDEGRISFENEKEKKWDCESILSTYSNIHHHPRLIEEPSIKKKSVRIRVRFQGFYLSNLPVGT